VHLNTISCSSTVTFLYLFKDNRIQLNANNNFEATSYINASPIHVTVKETHQLSFIVSQSPLKHTVNTFWQMVWESDVTVITMLSKLKVIFLNTITIFLTFEKLLTYSLLVLAMLIYTILFL